jgi:hypothetical protein
MTTSSKEVSNLEDQVIKMRIDQNVEVIKDVLIARGIECFIENTGGGMMVVQIWSDIHHHAIEITEGLVYLNTYNSLGEYASGICLYENENTPFTSEKIYEIVDVVEKKIHLIRN